MPPTGDAIPKWYPASRCTRHRPALSARVSSPSRQSTPFFVRQSYPSSLKLRFQNLILGLQVLDHRLLLSVQPPGEYHVQKMHRQRRPHARPPAFLSHRRQLQRDLTTRPSRSTATGQNRVSAQQSAHKLASQREFNSIEIIPQWSRSPFSLRSFRLLDGRLRRYVSHPAASCLRGDVQFLDRRLLKGWGHGAIDNGAASRRLKSKGNGPPLTATLKFSRSLSVP